MQIKSLYIPMDRRQAMIGNGTVDENTTGAALFADISGFTPLTEALARVYGSRRGAEELTHQINRVYNVLIAEVYRYGGTVIGFSGDAITCWFAEDPTKPMAALRATTSALAMQEGMKAFAEIVLPDDSRATLAMKAAVASGPARRFVVGDPSIQLIDTLVGKTVIHMAEAEHLANRGDVVVDGQTIKLVGEPAEIIEWRTDPHSHEQFAVVTKLNIHVEPTQWPEIPLEKLDDVQVRQWVLPAVYERFNVTHSEEMTELRPAVALFLRFQGIDYDSDPEAGKKLDTYIRWVQKIISRYEGNLIQLTIGDKGSYLYAAFGAPIAHEDDPRRAVSAALELRTVPAEMDFINHIHIGISQGLMRTGTYGSDTRHTYGVLGDEVNLAARLMQHAAPGEVLVSRRVQKSVSGPFVWETMPSIRVKGKSEPVPLMRVTGKQQGRTDSHGYNGALVGRDGELQRLKQFIEPIFNGHFAGAAIVYGEAGMGKSRLVYELHQRISDERDVNWFFCPAEQLVHQSLYPFRHFLRDYFAHDAEISDEENKDRFEEIFEALLVDLQNRGAKELAEELETAHSFLGAFVELHWENSLYEEIEPQLRHENLLLAFRTFIEAESLRHPIVLQIEDAHWLDSDSHDLIKLLTSNVENYPVAILFTSRYRDDGSHVVLHLEEGTHQLVIDLNRLSAEGVKALAGQALEGEISEALSVVLTEKTNGNPFFIEQMALDLHERGLLKQDGSLYTIDSKNALEIPTTINAVLIARLDRLLSEVKTVVQTASVLGQEFDTDVLIRMFQNDEHLSTKVKHAEMQAIWSGMNEVRYFFRHALLRDAAYDMQIQARLRQLHKLAGGAIEQVHATDLPAHYADLVYHFHKAEDSTSERRYAQLAAEHSAAESANAEALEYYSRALELTPESELSTRYDLLLAREHIYDLQGNRPKQAADISELNRVADLLADDHKRAEAALRRVHFAEVTNKYADAIEAAQKIVSLGESDGILRDQASGYLWWGRALIGQAKYTEAREKLTRAFDLAVNADLADLEADALREMGIIDSDLGEYDAAYKHFEQAMSFYHQVGYKRGECKTLNNLGMVLLAKGNYAKAQHFFDDALCLCHQIGYRHVESRVLTNLGTIALDEGDLTKAHSYFEKSLLISHEIGDRLKESISLGNLGLVELHQGNYENARAYQEKALHIAHELGNDAIGSEPLSYLSLVLHHLGDEQDAYDYAQQALEKAQTLNSRPLQALAYTCLGHAAAGISRHEEASTAYQKALTLRRELNQHNLAMDALAGLTRVSLICGDSLRALAHTEEILSHLKEHSLDGSEEPFRIYLTCYRALQANKDDRAGKLLEDAYQELTQRAAALESETLRDSFLNNVESHREIIESWKAQQSVSH